MGVSERPVDDSVKVKDGASRKTLADLLRVERLDVSRREVFKRTIAESRHYMKAEVLGIAGPRPRPY